MANIQVVHDYNEYFLYNEKGVAGLSMASGGIKIAHRRYNFLSKWFSRLEQKYGYVLFT